MCPGCLKPLLSISFQRRHCRDRPDTQFAEPGGDQNITGTSRVWSAVVNSSNGIYFHLSNSRTQPNCAFGFPRVNEQKRLQPSCKWGLTGHNIGQTRAPQHMWSICMFIPTHSVSGTSTNKAHNKRMYCTINQIINLYTACFFICSFVSDNPVLFLFSVRVHFPLFGPPLRQKPTLREAERGGVGGGY